MTKPKLTAPTTAPAPAQAPAPAKVSAAQRELAARILSRRRLLPFVQRMNPKYTAGWVHEDICRRLERFSDDIEAGLSPRLMLLMPPRHGKQLADSTCVPTPQGWTTHGELAVDDEVFGPDGKPCRVVAVSGKTPSDMLVCLTDGTQVRCHENHEWMVYDRNGSYQMIMSTKDMASRMQQSDGRVTLQLPTPDALQFPESPSATTPAPYELGVWLGGEGPARIPEAYRRGSVPQQLALLAGLVDACGHVELSTGRIRIATTQPELAVDIEEVAITLGFRPHTTLFMYGSRTIHTVGFQPTMHLPTKVAGKQPQRFAPQRRVGVKSVEYAPNGEVGHCIQVDRPDGLYVVGNHRLVVTHNSELASKMFPAWHLGRHPDHEIIACSYNISLAMGFSKKIKALLDDPSYQTVFEARLSPDNRSTEEWTLAGEAGGYVAAGVGGGITGKGAHCLIIDDPIKNAEEADSAQVRESIWDWYGSTAYTRLAPGAGVLAIQCMTGDTPVLFPDGTEKRLDAVRRGDCIATYENGKLTQARVAAQRSVGPDKILKITTKSGRVVRANGRHPFLATTPTGELKWIRARSLSTVNRIVVLKGSGESGQEWSVLLKEAKPAQGTSVTTATQVSDILELSPTHLPQHSTSDFTLDEILAIVPDGVEEVFDIQVDRTTNFIANGVVASNTWWHDDDLAGRLQQAMAADPEADQFEIIKYPAIAEAAEFENTETDEIVRISVDATDEAGAFAEAEKMGVVTSNLKFLRAKGDPLHAERYDIKKLRRIKATIATRFWSALYQQNPVPDDGAYFTKDQFRRAPEPARKNCHVYIAWDFAISEKAHNDYTVGSVGLQDENDTLHVPEVVRFKSADAFFIVDSILRLAQRWYHASITLGFEDGQIYRSLEALLKKRMRELQFYPSTIVLKPISDKMARARALQGRMQQGMVTFSQDAEWYDTVRNEMLRFPAGVHDDCVDSLAWMTQMAVGREPPRKPTPTKQKSWKDKLRNSSGTLTHMSA